MRVLLRERSSVGFAEVDCTWIQPTLTSSPLQSRVYEFTPEQAYNDSHVPWSEARVFVFLSVRLTKGGYDDCMEQRHVASEYLTKTKSQNEEWLGYSQHYGPDYPAYVFVAPLRSLSDLDITAAQKRMVPLSLIGWIACGAWCF
jgi:hypothetical protein